MTTLDLSHNKIGSLGSRYLGRILSLPGCVIMSLDLSDNLLDSESGQYLASALRRNDTLADLSLRLNQLGDAGAVPLLEAAAGHSCLQSLDLASNGLGRASAEAFASLARNASSGLVVADLSSNDMDEDAAEAIQEALQGNASLTSLDMRGNEGLPLDSAVLDIIQQATRRNELALRQLARPE